MRLIAYDAQVGTTPTRIFSFVPRQLHSIAFKAVAALELGEGSVEIGRGFELAAGEALGFNHLDFDMNDPQTAEPFDLYAVASVATEVRVFGWMR